MARFKVGDRVMMKFNTGRITRIAWNEFGYKSAEPAVVAAVDNGDIYFKYRVLLDNKNPTDYGYWWATESELSPLAPTIPSGWTSADEPPDNNRDVRALTANGEPKAWFSCANKWRIYFNDTQGRHAAPGEVIAWREIEPDEKVDTGWYIVTDQLFKITHAEAVELALELAKKGKASYIARVVEEVKPGKPEVIRMEE